MDTLWIIILLALGAIIFAALAKQMKWNLQPMLAALIGAGLVLGGLYYAGEVDFETADVTPSDVTTLATTFDVDLVSNNTVGATTQDNTSAADNDLSFTTPFEYSTTVTPTSVLNCTNNGTFVDPTYIFDVTPIAPAGATADDLVTLKYEIIDPGDAITVGGTAYAVIADHSDGDINAFWTITDKSDSSSIKDHDMISGSVSFLYTEAVRVNLTVVLHDDGLARLTDYDTQTIYAKLSNIDGSWSVTYPIILQLVEE